MAGGPRKVSTYTAMSQLQLTALGLTLYLSRARFCTCLSLWWGGAVIGTIIGLRGLCSIFAGRSVFTAAYVDFYESTPAKGLADFEGAFDVVSAILCIVGLLVTKGVPVIGQAAWLALRILLEIPIAFTAAVLLISDASADSLQFFTITAGVLAFDAFALFVSIQLLLFLELRARVSPSTHQFVAAAQRVALASLAPGGWGGCCRRHLVVAMLLDPDLRELLRRAGVPVARLQADLSTAAELDIVGEREQKILAVGLPFGADLQATIMDAAAIQEQAGDERLRADHLLLALCAGGELQVALGPGNNAPAGARVVKCGVNVDLVREQLHAIQLRTQGKSPPRGPPGPLVLGCLPLEETVATWALLKLAMEVSALFVLVFLGYGWNPITGLRSSKQLAILELFECLVGPVCNVLGLMGIVGHRNARREIYTTAANAGLSWDAGLDTAFNAVRKEPDASYWFGQLKRGADWGAVLWLWTVVDLLLDIPVLGLSLFETNACGAYAGGLASVTAPYLSMRASLVHCTEKAPPEIGGPEPDLLNAEDTLKLVGAALGVVLKAYASWLTLALWHQYFHGWTTADLRGMWSISPYSLLSTPMSKVLAGLPRWVQMRLGVAEAVPLLL